MKIGFHLNFCGDCQEALEFYRDILGGELYLLKYKDSPSSDSVQAEWQEKIVHAGLKTQTIEIVGADLRPDQEVAYQGFQLLIQVLSIDEAKRLYSLLSEGGEIIFPLQETFWSPCYGILNDKFGIPWEINCSGENVNT